MAIIEIDRNPPPGQLLLFGVLWLLLFAGVGAAVKGASLPLAAVVWVAAVTVPAVGWFFPEFLRRVYVGVALTTYPIGLVVSCLLLAAAYYLVLTPIGLGMRLLGHDPMGRRRNEDAATYWHARQQEQDPASYFRQF